MRSDAVFASIPDGWQPVQVLLAEDGSEHQPGFVALSAPRAPLRDLADAIHCLCLLHGDRPGPIDVARDRARVAAARDWLSEAADGFSYERGWLSRLMAAVGPLPSTPNQVLSETAVATQRHALEMLAASDRRGVALGAAAALVLDWRAMRPTLERIGERFGLDPVPCLLPGLKASQAAMRANPFLPDEARAFAFGAQQLIAQHRGLWGLVESRAAARAAR